MTQRGWQPIHRGADHREGGEAACRSSACLEAFSPWGKGRDAGPRTWAAEGPGLQGVPIHLGGSLGLEPSNPGLPRERCAWREPMRVPQTP